MEQFIVSARKYRPDTFQSVVGQKSITTTLKNAIETQHLGHAYLFCGPRGVGKTTCARIFAKTINCQNTSSETEACGQCESCVAFDENRSYNIHELDAASNNSVEDIRNLIEQVRIPPQIGTHSVYIIDEVHMLSSQAFNAFLKTLEEPPPHAIFVLATTEKHKILPTILSRCQIFDFNRIKVEDTVDHLLYVAESEGIKANSDALNIIAQKADGAMRDALSYFDQIVSFSGNEITYEKVIENLNVLDYVYYFELTDGFLANNIVNSLVLFDKILDKGFDGHLFITGLAKHFRDILVCRDPQTIKLLEVGTSIKEKYAEQAKNCSAKFLFQALSIANTCDLNYRTATNKRLLVELALMQLCELTNQKIEENKVEAKENESQKKSTPNQKTAQVATTQPPKETVASGISIKNALQGKAEPKKQKVDENIEQEPEEIIDDSLVTNFSQEELKKCWLEFAKKQEKISPRFYNALISNIPVLKDKFQFEVDLSSKLLADAMEGRKKEILSFLKFNLKNSKINMLVILAESKKISKPFTNTDKYKYLSEKNENLNDLKQKFNLDF